MKKKILFVIKLILAVLIIRYLFSNDYLTKENLIDLFRLENLPVVIAAALAFLLSQLCAALRLYVLLKGSGAQLPLSKIIRITLIGLLMNNVMLGTIGGDLIKGYYLTKNEKEQRGKSVGILMLDRLVGLSVLMCLSGVGLVYLFFVFRSKLSEYHDELLILALFVVAFITLGAVFLLFSRNEKFFNTCKNFLSSFLKKGFIYNLIKEFGMLARRPGTLMLAILLSAGTHTVSVFGFVFLIHMLETTANLFPIFAVSFVVMLLGVVPVTPGNIGWSEMLAAMGWSVIGSNAGAKVFFYWRMVVVLCSLIGGFYSLLISKDVKISEAKQAST